jgi:hypothetical protein
MAMSPTILRMSGSGLELHDDEPTIFSSDTNHNISNQQ